MSHTTVEAVALPRPLTSADAHELNAAVRSAAAESPIVLLVDATLSGKPFPTAEIRTAFVRDPDLAVLCVASGGHTTDAELPAAVSAFLPIVTPMPAIAFRRNVPLGEFPDLSDPLRGWLIHAAEHQLRLERMGLAGDEGPGEINNHFPRLRPDEPGREHRWLRDCLERLDLNALLPQIRSADDVTALRAGLLQMNDFLDASHQHSQGIEGAGRNSAGDYWHAVMHRREPDYANAKYWFRRVGSHPTFPELASRAATLLNAFPVIAPHWRGRLLSGGWDPFAFVDLCQSCPQSEADDLSHFARRLQWIEMQLLLEQTRRDAIGD
jgi:hypothetical protein